MRCEERPGFGLVVCAALVACGVVQSAARGQAAPEDGLLAGPEVREDEKAVGIAERRYAGEMMMPEVRPEIAALDLLELDAPARARVDALLAERAALVDGFVLGHLAELAAVKDASGLREGMTPSAGSRAQVRALLQGLQRALEPVSGNGPLGEQIAGLLPAEPGARYSSLLAEHEAELVAVAREKAEASGQPFHERQYRARRAVEVLRQELRSSADRTILAAAREFESFLSSAQLSVEGEATVRTHVDALVEKTRLRPQPEAAMVMLRDLFGELGGADRQRLIEALRAWRGARG